VRDHLAYSLYARGQTSFGQALATSEQIGIASFQELSTFDAGTIGGDSGWIVRGDLQSPWTVNWSRAPLGITPYAFAATGAVYLEQPTVLEQDSVNVASLGIGMTVDTVFDPGFSDASLTVELGRAFRDDDEPDENRLTVVGSYRF
jgi:hemolysin activation/secretion protein